VSEALAGRAIRGDAAAYARLVADRRSRLLTLAFSRTGCRDDALDAVQDAVVRGLAAIRDLRDPGAFGRWMDRLVTSACAEVRRRRILSADRAGDVPTAPTADTDESLWLASLLDALGDRDRALLWGFYASGMTVRELARSMGRPEGTIKRWLSEARDHALRRAIRMAGVLCVVGDDLADEERAVVEEGARLQSLQCEYHDDVWAAHEAMLAETPAAALLPKRLSGPCDTFMLLAMLKNSRDKQLGRVPVLLLGTAEETHIRAAWHAGVDCYLTRPFGDAAELGKFLGALLEAAEG